MTLGDQFKPGTFVQAYHFLVDNPGLYRRMLRIARFIEYGGQLRGPQINKSLLSVALRDQRRSTR